SGAVPEIDADAVRYLGNDVQIPVEIVDLKIMRALKSLLVDPHQCVQTTESWHVAREPPHPHERGRGIEREGGSHYSLRSLHHRRHRSTPAALRLADMATWGAKAAASRQRIQGRKTTSLSGTD